MTTVYLVTGATYPFEPRLWSSKRAAMACAANMRRFIRATYRTRGDCAIFVEPRQSRDMLHYSLKADNTGEFVRRG